MIRHLFRLLILALALGVLPYPPASATEPADAAAPVKVGPLTARDVQGNALAVPAADKPTVLLFVMADQDRSRAALQHLRERAGESPKVQPLAVVSGEGAAEAAARLVAETRWPWPVAVDPQYELSGALAVRVWPGTVFLLPDGTRAGYIGGLPHNYARSLEAYHAFVLGEIDQAALQERLQAAEVVESTPHQIAQRHLHLAQRLLERQQIDAAHDELEKALQIDPEDAQTRHLLARVHLRLGEPQQTLELLEGIAPEALPAWQRQTLRGRALVALERWDEGRAALMEALRLNPDPAEAHYWLGRVLERDQQPAQAAQHYRAAFEATAQGRYLAE